MSASVPTRREAAPHRTSVLHRRPADRGRGERGAIIILVLVTLLLASFLLTAFIKRSGTELLADARASQLKGLRLEAYSALESTLAVLADYRNAQGALRSPVEPWGNALADTGYVPSDGREVEVTFEDESAKVSLPNATEDELQALLELAGVERNEAERFARTLHAWMREAPKDASPSLDAPDYTRAEPAYKAAARPLRSWAELAAVELDRRVFFDEAGRPTAAYETFTRAASLHAFSKVNLNSAPAETLTALGLGDGELQSLQNYRERPKPKGDPGYFRSLAEAGTVLGNSVPAEKFGTAIEVLRIHVTVRQGAIAYRLSAVIAASGNTRNTTPRREPTAATPGSTAQATTPGPDRKVLNLPFSVLEIKEDAEPPLPPPAA